MNQDRHKIVVVGGGYVGATAAARVAGRAKGRADVKLIDPTGILVQRVRLHQIATDQKIASAQLEKACGRRVAQVRGWAESIDTDKGIVGIRDAEGAPAQAIPYDTLILTTGSAVDTTTVPGINEWTIPLSNFESAKRLGVALRAAGEGSRVAVVGGGLTGIETAAELAESRPDLRLSLVCNGRLGERFSNEGREYILKVYGKLGIDVLDGVRIQAVADGALEQEQGPPIPFDIAVWCGGFAPSTLPAESGLAVGDRGAALVDLRMRSISHPEVLVAGDAAEGVLANGGRLRMSCAGGIPAGAHAADVIGASIKGDEEKDFDFGFFAWCVSLGRKNALLQWVDCTDKPKEKISTGRGAVLFKWLACTSAFKSPSWEKRYPGAGKWHGGGKPKPQEEASATPAAEAEPVKRSG